MADDVIADGKVKSRMLPCVNDSTLARIIYRVVTMMVAWEAIQVDYEAQHELRQQLLVRQLCGRGQQSRMETTLRGCMS